jgi:sulfonate transport system substrate-binding protein
MRARHLLSAASLLMAALLVPQAQAAEPLKISIGWVVISGDMIPLVFEKPDILKHYGRTYTVEPMRFQGTSTQITALAANELDIASLAYSSLPLAIENAHLDDLRIIADGFQDGHPGYGSLEYKVRNDGSVKRVEDLKSKIMGINVIGAAVDIGGRAVLAKHGLNFPQDYSIVEAPFPALGAMLLEKKADVVALGPPFNYAPDIEKGAHTLFVMRDGMGASQMIVMVARKGFLEKNRVALDDFFDDAVRGIHWMQDPANREAAIKFVSGAAKQPESMFEPYFLTKKDEYHDPNAKPDLDALQRNIDAEVKLGFIKHTLDVKKYADLSFVERAAQRYAKEKTAAAQ